MQFPSNAVPIVPCELDMDPSYPITTPARDGQQISDRPLAWLHHHDSLELGMCMEGSGVFMVDGELFPYEEGSAVLVPGEAVHNVQSAPGGGSLWRFVNFLPAELLPGELFEGLEHFLRGEGRPMVSREGTFPRLVGEIIDLQLQRPPGYRDCVRGLVKSVLSLAAARSAESHMAGSPPAGRDCLAAVQIMMAHYDEPWTVPELAVRCAVRAATLRRAFRAMGYGSPADYLTRLRVRMAALLLLRDDCSVLDAAERCGFGSVTSLERHFRRVMGVTPREWRRQHH